ncbi:MAG: hypothetical protein EPN86_01420 [Nanoarchaeota archaeon]|nr:MAG: hypothetical protein EPN86_01420 [Nanoarchaeota archaeon]
MIKNTKYEDNTKEHLIIESAELRQRIENLKAEATKRKKTEEALKVSETRYRRLFETAQNEDIASR